MALDIARQSIVLLRNNKGILPLSKKLKSIAVIGPNANDSIVPLGNYNGNPAHVSTVLEGVRKVLGKDVNVIYNKACNIVDTAGYIRDLDFKPALEVAKSVDAIVFVGGISPRLEGEELRVNIDGFKGGDKTNLNLPKVQTDLLKELKKSGKPLILVLMNGSALSINWENENIDGIIEGWYGGEGAGQAIADVIFGDYNPAGRLPMTFYKSIDDIPAFEDYSMKGKTYRYCNKEVLYPFGYGLSYTKFEYSNLKLSGTELKDKLDITLSIKNTGKVDGDEVVQLYIHQQGQNSIKDLRGCKRLHLKAGKSMRVNFTLRKEDLLRYNKWKEGMDVLPGKVIVMVGTSSKDIRLKADFEVKKL